MVNLRGIEFGNLFCAPGALGFNGEGYGYHSFARKLGMNWNGFTFVAKTVTANPNLGNMPLGPDFRPRELMPRSVIVKWRTGHVLNAAGLSNPGARAMVPRWAERARHRPRSPFMISFMAIGESREERRRETQIFRGLIGQQQIWLGGVVGIQANFACPNTGHLPESLYEEIDETLSILGNMNRIPLVANFSPVTPLEVLVRTAAHPQCDALWIANTIPWGDPHIDWKELFGTTTSPLAAHGFGPGGLSGPACLPVTVERVAMARKAGIKKPIIAGNGIRSRLDVLELYHVGADAFAVGSVAMTRPWQMRPIREAAQRVAGFLSANARVPVWRLMAAFRGPHPVLD